ncbi:phosphopantetheine-binding protein [Anaerobiospirillum succiniciproducens]|uniref:phosphopantetheine-binding protein n=1 Tax=Anaerobiospirillum succiniciproducens TaxID=13335 RepID=UPI00248E4341|nr:phosphopantetheine-binding protein [Anaerobiospirillum succiniciproducens]
MNQIEQELKELIVEVLNLEDVSPSDIVSEDPLFNDGLGLDSIDALELGIAIKAKYGIVLNQESDEIRKQFYSVKTLAQLIANNKVD